MSNSQENKAEQGMERYFFRASSDDFRKIPGQPIAYWATSTQRLAFEKFSAIGSWAPVKQGLATADNSRFVRAWHEISVEKLGLGYESTEKTKNTAHKWFPYNKGGDFRKWYGNFEFVVLWENDGSEIRNFADDTGYIRSRAQNTNYYFRRGVTWTFISSSRFGVRYSPSGSIFDVAGSSAFPPENLAKRLTAFLASNLVWGFLKLLNPTLNFQVGNVASLPLSKDKLLSIPESVSDSLIQQTKEDWDAYETSWDFTSLPLLHPDYRQPTLKASYQKLRAHWSEMALEMQRLEKENNCIFIDAFGLQDELTPEVPLNEITLTCNPHYRYGGDKSEEELEALLLADTMRELVSYAVGCMFGRYSLDKPGLVLANQGETLADYLRQVPEPRFMPDDDNVIPLLDGEWFADDVTERFRLFLREAFGEAHYENNLAFIEQALNIKGKRNYSLRDYFLGEFYADHVKRYKKRPIYWLFSSPKGTFNALVYLHRYRPDTVSVVLQYLRDFRKKLAARLDYLQQVAISTSASQGEKTKANKEAETIKKQLLELDDYERDTLYPLATEQVKLDLDDGVKVNYLKLGSALKKIVGLDAKGED